MVRVYVFHALATCVFMYRDLQHNLLPEIDHETFAGLTFYARPEASSLRLQFNNISRISDGAFRDLAGLQWLAINAGNKDNPLLSISNETLQGLSSVVTLGLFDEGSFARKRVVSVAHDAFRWCTSVGRLSLRYLPIRAVKQTSFSGLKNLYFLDLSENHITHIQAWSFAGRPLTPLGKTTPNTQLVLKLGSNSITTIAFAFAGATQLTSLYLHDNGIPEIPATAFINCTVLATLDVSRNSITRIADYAFADASKLASLELEDNQITQIAKHTLEGLSALEHLDLHNNHIAEVREDSLVPVGGTLVFLDLDDNRLTEISSGTFSQVPKLVHLLLNRNSIVTMQQGAFNNLASFRRCKGVNGYIKTEGNTLQCTLPAKKTGQPKQCRITYASDCTCAVQNKAGEKMFGCFRDVSAARCLTSEQSVQTCFDALALNRLWDKDTYIPPPREEGSSPASRRIINQTVELTASATLGKAVLAQAIAHVDDQGGTISPRRNLANLEYRSTWTVDQVDPGHQQECTGAHAALGNLEVSCVSGTVFATPKCLARYTVRLLAVDTSYPSSTINAPADLDTVELHSWQFTVTLPKHFRVRADWNVEAEARVAGAKEQYYAGNAYETKAVNHSRPDLFVDYTGTVDQITYRMIVQRDENGVVATGNAPSTDADNPPGRFLVDDAGGTLGLFDGNANGRYRANLEAVDGAGAVATVLQWAFNIAERPRFGTVVGWNPSTEATRAGFQSEYISNSTHSTRPIRLNRSSLFVNMFEGNASKIVYKVIFKRVRCQAVRDHALEATNGTPVRVSGVASGGGGSGSGVDDGIKFLVDDRGGTLTQMVRVTHSNSGTACYSGRLVAADGAGAVATVFRWNATVFKKQPFKTAAAWQTFGPRYMNATTGYRDIFVQHGTYQLQAPPWNPALLFEHHSGNDTDSITYSMVLASNATCQSIVHHANEPSTGNGTRSEGQWQAFGESMDIVNMSTTTTTTTIATDAATTTSAQSQFFVNSAGATLARPTHPGQYHGCLVAHDSAGERAVVHDWKFQVLPNDTAVNDYGPNGAGCQEGTPVDDMPFDKSFSCICHPGYEGENCVDKRFPLETLIAVLSVVLLCFAGAVYVGQRYFNHWKSQRPVDFETKFHLMREAGLIPDTTDVEEIFLPREIRRKHVRHVQEIGRGQFGKVWKSLLTDVEGGVYRGEYPVAAKTMLDVDPVNIDEIVAEGMCVESTLRRPHGNATCFIVVCRHVCFAWRCWISRRRVSAGIRVS